MRVDIAQLISDYYEKKAVSKVKFGTSGHRGSSERGSFNEEHILAITTAIVMLKKELGYDGEIIIGRDTHALSIPAQKSAVGVLSNSGVDVVVGGITPTPVISFTILERNKKGKKCDGIVITPSHNPPEDGGFKYNPVNGGPADTRITKKIEEKANILLGKIKKTEYKEPKTEDLITPYVNSLSEVVDMELIKNSKLKIAADPLGGSAVNVYKRIKEVYEMDFDILDGDVDYTFSFMPPDWDGKIRMDCSSPYAMRNLLNLKERYDLAFANDTDADRHGIVTKEGLMNPNHYLSVMVWYLFQNRDFGGLKVGKTVVTTSMIDRIAKYLGVEVYETPVGFKYFAEGLYEGWLAFGCEESAGASFLRFNRSVWSSDKDGIIPSLLAVEIYERLKKSPSEIYKELEEKFGKCYYERIDVKADDEIKAKIKSLTPGEIEADTLGGERIEKILTKAPGNNEPIGGVKIVTKNGWAAVRPSGTEDIYKIYAESFISKEHLKAIEEDVKNIVKSLLRG